MGKNKNKNKNKEAAAVVETPEVATPEQEDPPMEEKVETSDEKIEENSQDSTEQKESDTTASNEKKSDDAQSETSSNDGVKILEEVFGKASVEEKEKTEAPATPATGASFGPEPPKENEYPEDELRKAEEFKT